MTTATQEVKTFNIKTKKGLQELEKNYNYDEGSFNDLFDVALFDYLKGEKEPVLYYGDHPLLSVEDKEEEETNYYLIDSNKLYGEWGLENFTRLECCIHLLKAAKRRIPNAVLIKKAKRTENNKDFKSILLINADMEASGFFGDLNEDKTPLVLAGSSVEFPTVSFMCIGRFYGKEDWQKPFSEENKSVVDEIVSGNLRLLDYTPDESIALTAKEIRSLNNNKVKPLEPPQAGFTLVKNRWHRPSTTLFYDVPNKRYLLFGQDEGTYFGCELKSAAKTVKDAFEGLIPKEAREKDYIRQGEWFAVPITKDEVPEIDASVISFQEIALPLETPDSNAHWINAVDGIIDSQGKIYARNFTIDHDEHNKISSCNASQWYTFYRNTAKRSVSQEGVD